MTVLKPFKLLEINVISAQDLEPVSRKMKTYAIAWVHPTRKLTGRLDKDGNVDPIWNDKFVFRIDEDFFYQDASAVHIEIYCVHWLRDTLIGAVSILIGNLFPPHFRQMDTRFVALQVLRPSGRPQGILNIGVALLDSSNKSMPLYRQPSIGLGLGHHSQENINQNRNQTSSSARMKPPMLWRTKSERSDRMAFDKNSTYNNSSIVEIPCMNGGAKEKDYGSILSISIEPPPPPPPRMQVMKKKKGKASSVISGAELREKPKMERNVKLGSALSDSVVSKDSTMFMSKPEVRSITVSKVDGVGPALKMPLQPTVTFGKPKPKPKYNLFEQGGSKVNNKFINGPRGPGSIWSNSEKDPSASEVAAVMAKYPLRENQSSVLDGWSAHESDEGFESKLERWRTELPAIYDRGYSTASTSHYNSRNSQQHNRRRHSDGESAGMFSCFGNINGYECQCVCGQPPEHKSRSARYHLSPSNASRSFY